MEVEVTVALIKKSTIAWPRLESAEMHCWLPADHGFSERGASTFLGQPLEYEIANVVDPNFPVVARMRRSLLRAVSGQVRQGEHE